MVSVFGSSVNGPFFLTAGSNANGQCANSAIQQSFFAALAYIGAPSPLAVSGYFDSHCVWPLPGALFTVVIVLQTKSGDSD